MKEDDGEEYTTKTSQGNAGESAEAVPDEEKTNETTALDNESPLNDANPLDEPSEQLDDEQYIQVPLSPEVVDDVGQEDIEYYSESESEDEPEVWRCEICRKDFKSEAQLQNHMRSKKHKEAVKKHQAKLNKKEQEIMAEMMDEMTLDNQ